MKRIFVITVIAIAAILFMPPLVSALSATVSDSPLISQPLVREGTLAVRLSEALKVGATSSETEAESMLGAAGIAPRNGWIADYPATPDIIGELQQAIGEAADSKRIAMGRDEALKAFDDVMIAYNLSIRPSTPSQAAEYTTSSGSPDSTVINNYYYDEGPPIVTYYAPPSDYYYLYSWVPYPFWWWDFWFPGFFVLADFDFDIGHGHHGHHGHGEHGEFVSNHFRDPQTGQMARVDPAQRVSRGTFADRGGAGWSSPSARSSAQAIFNNQNVAMAGRSGIVRPAGSGTMSGKSLQNGTFTSPSRTQGAISGAPHGRTFNSPSVTRGTTSASWGGNKTVGAPSVSRWASIPSAGDSQTFGAPSSRRSFSQPSVGSRPFAPSYGGRSFGAPSGSRTFSAPSFSGGRTFGSRGGNVSSFGGFSRR